MCSAEVAASSEGAGASPYVAGGSLAFQAIGGINSALAANNKGQADSNYYTFLQKQNNTMAAISKSQGELRAGLINDQAANQSKLQAQKNNQLNASATAQQAANGVAGSVTAQQVQQSNINNEDQDQAAIKYNADLAGWNAKKDANFKALGYQTDANGNELAATNSRTAGAMNMFSTLLDTAASVGSKGADMYANGAFNKLRDADNPNQGGSNSTYFKAGSPDLKYKQPQSASDFFSSSYKMSGGYSPSSSSKYNYGKAKSLGDYNGN